LRLETALKLEVPFLVSKHCIPGPRNQP